MPSWSSAYFQNSASPFMTQLTLFHDHTMALMTTIIILITLIMALSLMQKMTDQTLLHAPDLEIIWTSYPLIVLLAVALPSLYTLYLAETPHNPALILKVMGHQWYWSYQYSASPKMEFDSFLQPLDTNPLNRLLDTDNSLVLPVSTPMDIMITSTDVIHSWSVPALGLKSDAMPGRLNMLSTSILNTGVYFGQCSEICGINHSFMPIKMEVIPMNKFISWMLSS